MTQPVPANLNTQGFGNRPENVEIPTYQPRPPTSADVLWPQGKRWIDTVNVAEWVLATFSSSQGAVTANWIATGGGTAEVSTLTGDSGTATPVGGNIKIAGTSNQITTAGAGSSVTLSLSGPYTPATYTAHGVLLGEGTSSVVAVAPSATTGVALVSQGAAADPAYGTVVVAGGGTGAVTLTGIVTGNGTSAMTANAVTQHGVLLGGASNAASSLGVAATGTVLAGASGADPAFTGSPSVSGSVTAGTTLTATLGNITATNGNVVLGTTGNKLLIHASTAASDSIGSSTLSTGGSVTIMTSAITASSLVFLSYINCTSANPAALSYGTIMAGTSFIVHSQDASDTTSTFNYWIVN